MSREKFHLFLSAFLFTIPLAAAQNAQAEESVPVPPQPSAEAQAPEAGSDRFDFADGLYARGMYDMASAEYEKLIAEMPSHSRTPDALFRLAESFFSRIKPPRPRLSTKNFWPPMQTVRRLKQQD